MKIKKLGAIAAAALVMTSLAVSASASNLPGHTSAGMDNTSVKAADVDLSAIDWANIREGELVAIGTVDPAAVNGGTTTAGKDAVPEAAVYAVDADVDMSAVEWAGEPVAIGEVDPGTVLGGFTTQARPAK